LPDVIIGEKAMVECKVHTVTKDVPANCLVFGVPAVIKKSYQINTLRIGLKPIVSVIMIAGHENYIPV
jgi:serine acetyltransferase